MNGSYKVGIVATVIQTMVLLPGMTRGAADTSQLEDYLDMDFEQLMEVTVTSVAKREQSLKDIAAAVYVISSEEIKRSGVTSIPDALALAPGIHVAKITSSKWSVSSRGFAGYTSNKLLVLLDGRSVYSPAFSGTFWDLPNTLLEDIERIEIIRGPGGTIWGSNAVNGVINIITKSTADTQNTLVRMGVGTEDRLSAAVRTGGALGEKTTARIYVDGHDRDSNSLADGSDGGDDWKTLQSGFKVEGELTESTNWTVQGDVLKNSGDQIISPYYSAGANYPNWVSGDFTTPSKSTDIDSRAANILTKLDHKQENGNNLSLQMYYDYRKKDEDPYNFEFNTVDFDLNYDVPLNPYHKFTFGAGYRYIESSFSPTLSYYLPDGENDLISAFLQDELHLFDDKVIATVGLKWEDNDFTGGEWQPSARLLWKARDNHSLWVAASRAVRIPSLIEDSGTLLLTVQPLFDQAGNPVINPATGSIAEVPLYAYGDESFDSEVVYAYEMGHRWQVNKELSTDISVFYNDYSDLYYFFFDSSRNGYTFVNAVEADSYGVELALQWQPREWLRFDATYTGMRSSFEESLTGSSDVIFSETSPDNIVGLRASVNLDKHWQLNTWLRWQDETATEVASSLYQERVVIDDFFTLDANIIWNPKPGLEVMLAGQNLLADSQLQYRAEVFSPPTEIDRGVYIKLTWSF